MNDPGTAEPIKQAADELEPDFSAKDNSDAKEQEKQIDEEERDYRDPKYAWQKNRTTGYRSLLVSTAFTGSSRRPFLYWLVPSGPLRRPSTFAPYPQVGDSTFLRGNPREGTR